MKTTAPRLLAVDSTGEALSVAALNGDKLVSVRRRSGAHDEALLPAVDEALARAGLTFSRLQAVAAASGPGRFTGIRIGMSFVALASSQLRIPALAVSRLEALAFAQPPGRLCAVISGWREERYHQNFQRAGAQALPKAQGPAAWTAAQGWPVERERLERAGWRVVEQDPDARALALLAAKRLSLRRIPRFAPFYLKPAGYELKLVR